uniref:Interleukin 17 receptor C n=1 Tax=Electrophorus electricus TaxID=8005 RepID=A0A4W4E285_ELEEL
MELPWGMLFMLTGALVSEAVLENYYPKQNITCSQASNLISKEAFPLGLHDFGPVEILGLDVKPMLCCKENRKCKTCVHTRILLRILPKDDEGEKRSGEHEDSGKHTFKVVCVCSCVCVFVCVCSCVSPRIYPEIDRHKGVVELKEASEDLNQPKSLLMCMKRGRQGMCLVRGLPPEPTPHLFHQAIFPHWKLLFHSSSLSKKQPTDLNFYISAFLSIAEFQKNIMKNVSLSVAHAVSNKGHPVLSWNLTAPCRLEAELWPCQMEAESDSGCKEVQGFRVTLGTYSQWQENVTTLWVSTSLSSIFSSCFVMCPSVRRGRWSILVLVTLLVFSLTVFGMYVLREKLKEGLGEVLLLHTSEADQGSLVCGLGTVLSEIGFRVYLDLWSQAEVCSVGPAPWLHSHISHLHKHSGKALILLSGSALDRENGIVGDKPLPGISLDVFGSALGCILSDHLKDGAADHFALVQFDSHKFINREMDVPELFQGLRLYQLPSETCRLLTELHADRPESISAQLKMVLWLRRASRRLAKGLRDSGKELRTRADSMFTQLDVLSMEGEETVI